MSGIYVHFNPEFPYFKRVDIILQIHHVRDYGFGNKVLSSCALT